MIACELLAIKVQELLGKKYKIVTMDDYFDGFTQAAPGMFGTSQLAISTQAFNENKDVIIGAVSLETPLRANADYYCLAANYSIDFWVFTEKKDKNGKVKFNFEGDIEKLIDKITNKEITFADGKYGRISMSEPFGNGVKEDTATGKRKLMHVKGRIVLTDKGVFGGSYKYYIRVNGEWVKLDGVNSVSMTYQLESNAINLQSEVKTMRDVAGQDNGVTLNFDNYVTDNAALNKIKEISKFNLTILTEKQSPARQKKLHVKIDYGDGTEYIYWAVPNIKHHATKNEIGSFTVDLTNDNKDEDDWEDDEWDDEPEEPLPVYQWVYGATVPNMQLATTNVYRAFYFDDQTGIFALAGAFLFSSLNTWNKSLTFYTKNSNNLIYEYKLNSFSGSTATVFRREMISQFIGEQ